MKPLKKLYVVCIKIESFQQNRSLECILAYRFKFVMLEQDSNAELALNLVCLIKDTMAFFMYFSIFFGQKVS